MRSKVEAEYEQLKQINSNGVLDEWQLPRVKITAEVDPINFNDDLSDLSTQANTGCDYKKLIEECFTEDAESNEAYELCSVNAGCSVGATRRPMYDKMSFRRK